MTCTVVLESVGPDRVAVLEALIAIGVPLTDAASILARLPHAVAIEKTEAEADQIVARLAEIGAVAQVVRDEDV